MHAGGQRIFLIRHGETEWSAAGRHTGRTDMPLTNAGKRDAERLGSVLAGLSFDAFTSPLQRAKETAGLAGFPAARIDDDLCEWDYGVYEGRTTLDIRKETPEWSVWLSPITGGESLEDVATRANRVIARILETATGDVGLFAHGHFLRIFAACWMEMPPLAGRRLGLDTATISILGYERQTRVIRRWNVGTTL